MQQNMTKHISLFFPPPATSLISRLGVVIDIGMVMISDIYVDLQSETSDGQHIAEAIKATLQGDPAMRVRARSLSLGPQHHAMAEQRRR